MAKKITLKMVEKMNDLWEEYLNVPYDQRETEESKKAHDDYFDFKKNNFNVATEIEDEALLKLLSEEDKIHLPGVNKLSMTAYTLIGKTDLHEVRLDGITEMTDDEVGALSGLRNKSKRWRTRNIDFNGLIKLPDNFYTVFGTGFKSGGNMGLAGITELTGGEEKALSKIKFNAIYLRNLKKVSPKGFSKFKGSLILGIEELPLELAQATSKWKSYLTFTKVSKITPEIAAELIKSEEDFIQFGTGYYHNIKDEYSWECAPPDGLRTLPADVAMVFANKRYWKIAFNGITELTVEAATELNKICAHVELHNFDPLTAPEAVLNALSAKRENAEWISTKTAYIKRKDGTVEKMEK